MSWTLEQLFPICIVPTCPKFKTRHMLDHQKKIATQILTGEENYIYWQGGVGSAKTLLWGALAVALPIIVPNSKSILFRKFYGDNYKTLWMYFKASVKAAVEQGIIRANYNKMFSVKKQGDYTTCEFPNGSLIYAGETKSITTFMGSNYDFIFVSDAMENDNFGLIFHGEGTIGGLQSRLRGQTSSFFKLADGTYKDMRRFLIESNPPPNINELHSIFGKEPGVRKFPPPAQAVTYRHIQSTSLQNDHNPPTYRDEIASQHTDPSDIKRILEGKTIPYYGGVRVIPTFHTEIHVNSFDTDENLPLFCSIDPGIQHPSVIFAQIKKCSYEKDHVIALSEITNLYDKTTEKLIELEEGDQLGLLAHLSLFYPSHFDREAYTQIRASLLRTSETDFINYSILEEHFLNIRFCIDKAGEKRSSANKDRDTDRLIFLRKYGIRCKMRTNIGLNRSLSRVRESFEQLCLCNIPVLLVDRKCSLLTDAYSGGYRYRKNPDGSHAEEPLGDHRYEDPADAHRYLLENFFFLKGFEAQELENWHPKYEDRNQWMYGKEPR